MAINHWNLKKKRSKYGPFGFFYESIVDHFNLHLPIAWTCTLTQNHECVWGMKHSHSHHGFVVDALWRMNVWGQFLKLVLNLLGHPFPSSTSSFIVGSPLSSHTFLLMDYTSWMHYVQKPMASSTEYPFAMFHAYLFKAFIYCSMGYIHLVATWPHGSNSSARCITKWHQINW